MVDHSLPDHHFERLADADSVQRKELEDLVAKSKEKISQCEDTSAHLSNALSELENQRENTKSLIEETFQVNILTMFELLASVLNCLLLLELYNFN